MDRDQEDARDLIASLVRDTGWSVTEVARRAGVAPSTLTRIYPTPSVKYTLSARTLSKLRQLQPSPAPAMSMVREERVPFGVRADDVLPLFSLAPAYPLPSGMLADKLEWLAGDMDQPIDHVAWPLAGGSDDRYFLTYMPDDSMAPRFRSGDYLLVDRVKPAASGAEVLVTLAEPAGARATFCCIAQLVDRNRSQVRLRQYADDVAETLSRRDVAQIYAIVGSFDETLRR